MFGLVDTVKQSLARLSDVLTWQPVSLKGLDIAWVGMQVPAIDSAGRPWVWEVVTPDQFAQTPLLHDDPMVLPVQQDTVVVTVNHADHSGPIVRMQVPVTRVPEHVAVDRRALPQGAWTFGLETGWTTQALGTAAQCWIDREVGCNARLNMDEPTLESQDSYQLSPSINIEASAFDRLLTLAPDEAAVVSSALCAIHEALEPYR
ncbi:MAG: hypothetical protein FJW98_06790 [Actinobacteria bacterium]|nr:hypothetical protein [Actinomycetota bacterium]